MYIPFDGDGYIKFNISRRVHNKFFRLRKLRFFQHAEYYYNGESLQINYCVDRWFLSLIALPKLIIGTFLEDFPRTIKNIRISFNKNTFAFDAITLPYDNPALRYKLIYKSWQAHINTQ
jgi:hypothetical protein